MIVSATSAIYGMSGSPVNDQTFSDWKKGTAVTPCFQFSYGFRQPQSLLFNGFVFSYATINTSVTSGVVIPSVDFSFTVDVVKSVKWVVLGKVESISESGWSASLAPVDESVFTHYLKLGVFDHRASSPWSKGDPLKRTGRLNYAIGESSDSVKTLTYGYSVNEFLIGGSVVSGYKVADNATSPPLTPGDPGEVIQIVNVINVVSLPERSPVSFTALSMAIDLDSFSWVINLTIGDQSSFDLIKPSVNGLKEIEVSVNNEVFVFFIGRSRSSKSNGSTSHVCTGWSLVRLLTFPYSKRGSRVENSQSTPEGIVTTETLGTGASFNWETVTWTIPSGVFRYMTKSPLAAIVDLVKSVGAVVVPGDSSLSFSVVPRYPTSPWSWDSLTPAVVMYENSFFSTSSEWVPRETPDSIYVYGGEGGVGVKCVKNGTAGINTLPSVVDRHITDSVAGAERGRIEIAKASPIESVPISTYVDVTGGIIKPLTMVNVVGNSGDSWNGQVVRTNVTIEREGTAIIQNLTVERYRG